MDYLESVRVRALVSVVEPDREAFFDSVFEWYSKEYHTPLHTVETLPLDKILYTYYRSVYRNMEPQDRHNEAVWLLETPEERAARQEAVRSDEDEFLRQAEETNRKAVEKKKLGKEATKVTALLKKMKQRVAETDPFANSDSLSAPKLPETAPPAVVKPLPEVSLPSEPAPEETVTYMTDADFEAELDRTPGPPPRRKG